MPWRSWLNAEIYDRFVRERPIYGWLNRILVETADVAHGRRVLDLGCGTGATTLACLREIGATAEVIGIDASEEMVQVARANVHDPRAAFEVLPAAEADRLPGKFDRVVCNAAFWQFPAPGAVIGTLSRCSEDGALFAFNVPAERVLGEVAAVHPYQITLMREIEGETGERFGGSPARLDPAALEKTGAEHGFAMRRIERRVYEARQDELMELMSIPAMIEPLTPGLSPERRDELLDRARAHSDPQLRVAVPWVYFLFERRQTRPD